MLTIFDNTGTVNLCAQPIDPIDIKNRTFTIAFRNIYNCKIIYKWRLRPLKQRPIIVSKKSCVLTNEAVGFGVRLSEIKLVGCDSNAM